MTKITGQISFITFNEWLQLFQNTKIIMGRVAKAKIRKGDLCKRKNHLHYVKWFWANISLYNDHVELQLC